MSSLPLPESKSLPKAGQGRAPVVSDFPKGLTPITTTLLDALMKDKRYWHPTKRDPAFQRQVERGFQAIWDFKNKDLFKNAAKANGVSRDDLQRFGNFHFGYMANAFGFGLGRTLSGAGLYQAFRQGGGSKSEAIAGAGYGHSNTEAAQFFTDNGFTWGDNPGDSKDIMEGWLHYENTRRKAAQ